MKKIINGKKYDTTTAQNLGSWDNGYGGRDFQFCAEALYIKKTGEYFLYGEGGAMSKYAVRCGNMSGGGEDILPLTPEHAKEWAEKYLTADEYEQIFGEVDE